MAVSVASVMIDCGPTVKEPRIPAKIGAQIKHTLAAQMMVKGVLPPPSMISLYVFTLLTRKYWVRI